MIASVEGAMRNRTSKRRSMFTRWHRYVCLLLLPLLSAAGPANARTIDLTPQWGDAGQANHQRVFLGGDPDSLWISADDATGGPLGQQWQWLDFSSALDRLAADDEVTSATLSWFGNVESDQSDGTTVWSVFPAPPDGAMGRLEILGPDRKLDASDVVKYYTRHRWQALGEVTTRDIAMSSPKDPVTWDVTPLVHQWQADPAAPNTGELIILNDRNRTFGRADATAFVGEDWINWGQVSGFFGGTGPRLEVEVVDAMAPAEVAGLQPGDADQDLDFDQLDLVKVQIAAKYLTGRPATWGDGDWNGGPGGRPGSPPPGDGRFNQLDIIAALRAGVYLTGSYGQASGQVDPTTTTPAVTAGGAGPFAALTFPGPNGDGQATLSADLVHVPEPSSMMLLVLALAAAGLITRRRAQ